MTVATQTQSALVGGPSGKVILSNSAPLPQEPLRDVEVAVEVKAISLNPVDSKMVGVFLTPGATLGFDAAGVVTAVGSTAATEWDYRVGDRVVVAINGMNRLRPTIGGFAEHTVSYAWGTLKIPDSWSFAQAAGGMGGSAWLTVPWALFYSIGLPAGPLLEPLNSRLPPPQLEPKINIVSSHGSDGTKPPTAVLVNGGGSYTGTCAIQLLKLAGYRVIATCSPRSYELAQSFGADAVFDYADPMCAANIRTYAKNSLRLVIDCIATTETTRLCFEAMGRAGGRYVSLDPYSAEIAASRTIVRPSWVVGMEPLGDEIAWPAPYGRDANPVALDFCQMWNPTMQGLLDRGLIRLHPQRVRDTGLAGALEGLEEIRQKKVSGQKLIYTL
ncbi:hypothetical protein OIDMADRAFT_36230 [Oidiodendron maius Zn]|uniref:Enoyl reductase (ER) domain-containing protein n=1 Tax=Oidiodendron maius (strain Zn) TaxID=913774 RepID=A0A0C3C204_OIDMZ|nr:hypothetical protein OIDMADRAFT_36230 [Oidiodendron maius Zn]